MNLSYIKYKPSAKQLIVLILGTRNFKTCLIESRQLPESEKKLISKHAAILDGLNLAERTTWIRTNCPQGYKRGYKEIHDRNIEILKDHKI